MPLEFEKPIEELEAKIAELEGFAASSGVDLSGELQVLRERLAQLKSETFDNLSRWERVQLARAPGRPTTLDVIGGIMTEFVELYGDRTFGEDPAVVGAWPALRAPRWWWWATRKAATPRKTSGVTSPCPTPKATAKPCG